MNIILQNIKNAIDAIQWQSETKKKKAIELCEYIYHLYIMNGGDFNNYLSLSKEYFKTIIKTQNYIYEIKNSLISNGVLEVNNSYDIKKHIAKGYRFNEKLINGSYVVLCGTKQNKVTNDVVLCGTNSIEIFQKVAQSKNVSTRFHNLYSSINNPNQSSQYHICGTKLETYIYQGLSKIKFDEEVQNWIDNYEVKRNMIKVNEEITQTHIDIIVSNKKLRYSLEKAKEVADKRNQSLIQLKDKFYIEDVNSFLKRKTNDNKLIFEYSIANIENKKFRCKRNETNRRLDYNLTNMKSNLIDFIRVDGEKLIELDISNAQFAILNFIISDLDKDFSEKAIQGTLYETINKQKMFRIAFDKVKKEQDDIRNIFPKTMEFIDGFKKKNGYDSVSNLLQNMESLIMIDGLLPRLIEKGFQVFPIHDAIRVKESESELVKKEIEAYFNEINFECKLRIKNKKETPSEQIEILYKGFKKVMIDKPTKDEKELFLNKIKELGGNPTEWMVMETNLFEYYKLWLFYNKWREKNPNPITVDE